MAKRASVGQHAYLFLTGRDKFDAFLTHRGVVLHNSCHDEAQRVAQGKLTSQANHQVGRFDEKLMAQALIINSGILLVTGDRKV
jgi:hypothetical protein